MSLTKISNNSLSAISTLPASIPTGALTLLSTQTASSSASIEFTSGIDSTYDSYVFKFINIHPSTTAYFGFQVSTNSGSTYATTVTNTYFHAQHNEGDTYTNLTYDGGNDQAQGTGLVRLHQGIDHDTADENGSGFLHLFNPSSSVFVKHYIARNVDMANTYMQDAFAAGYFNTISAIDAVQFKMSSGNIDDGIIKMYGVS